MKRFLKKIFKLVFLIVFFSCFIEYANANPTGSSDISTEHHGYTQGGTSDAGSAGCSYGGCWNFPYNLGFRFTLVYSSGDTPGKKVEGTHSVDFSSNAMFNPSSSFYKKNVYHMGDEVYGYKYSDIYGDYNNAKDFVSVYVSNLNLGEPFKNAITVGKFLNDDFQDIDNHDRGWFCETDEGKLPCSFLDFFLHLTGYLEDDEYYYTSVNQKKNDLKKYMILIEPTYFIGYDENKQNFDRYGTVTEIAKKMISTTADDFYGLEAGLGRVLPNNTLLCMSTKDKNGLFSDFELLENGTDQCNSSIPSGSIVDSITGKTKYEYVREIANSRSPRGINFGVVSGTLGDTTNSKIKHGDPSTISSFIFDLNSCNYSNENKISFGISDGIIAPEYLLNTSLKTNKSTDEKQSVYCFDSVDYYFDKTISSLKASFNKFSFVNPPSSSAQVDRYCLLGMSKDDGKVVLADYKLSEDIKSYRDNGIKIHFYGNDYEISPSNFEINDSPSIIKSEVSINGNLYRYVKYHFEFQYDIPEDTLFIGDDIYKDVDYDLKNVTDDSFGTLAYISLSNWKKSFGRSNVFFENGKLGEKVLKWGTDVYYNSDKAVIDSEFNDSSFTKIEKDILCPIEYKINNSKTNINFRVISLSNPFPGRDGSSRMPSENWLYDENNVYNYITTGRGLLGNWHMTDKKDSEGNPKYELDVDPELIYSRRDPMYTITLTPSTMLKIRGYNKKYSYYSMYDLGSYESAKKINKNDNTAKKLRCNEQGRECYSEFLRTIIPQDEKTISGVCFMGRDETDGDKIRNEFNEIYDPSGIIPTFSYDNVFTYVESLTNNVGRAEAISYNGDLNYNGRIDSEDLDIMITYAKSYSLKTTEDEKAEKDKLGGDFDMKNYYTSYRPNKYYTCASKSYKSGGPVEEVK